MKSQEKEKPQAGASTTIVLLYLMAGVIPSMIMIDGIEVVSGEVNGMDDNAQTDVVTEGLDAPIVSIVSNQFREWKNV